jgi:predicted nucleotidyltransferase
MEGMAMRIRNPLDDIFGNRNNVRILRHMTLYPSPVITGRGLAKELSMSHATCIRSLNTLVDTGVITRKTIGRSSVYEIPRDSAVFLRLLQPVFAAEKGLLNDLEDILLKDIKGKVQAAYLFGSVARDEDTVESDIDVMLVLSQGIGKRQVEKAIEANRKAAYGLYRAGINVMVYGYDEFRRMKAKGHALIREVLSDGVLFWGKEV